MVETDRFIFYYLLKKQGLNYEDEDVQIAEEDKEIFHAIAARCSEVEKYALFDHCVLELREAGLTQENYYTTLKELIGDEPNWGRVLSVVALSGALVADCRKRNEERNILYITDWTVSFAQRKLRRWIEANGGLTSVLQRQRKTYVDKTWCVWAAVITSGAVLFLLLFSRHL